MERMEKRTDFYDFIDKIQRQDRYIKELEEENKKLKEELAKEGIRMDMMNHYNEIKEENKKLREEIKEVERRKKRG